MWEDQFFQLGLTAFIGSFVLSWIIILSQKWHGRLSHDHDLDGVQKVHTTAVPRIGGLAVFGGILAAILIAGNGSMAGLKAADTTHISLLLGAGLPAFFAGLIEDVTKRVSVRLRLAATALSALVASLLLGATVNELDIWGVDSLLTILPLAIFVTAIVVAGGSNAVNIIDGFNGLAGSTIVIMAAGLSAVAWQNGDTLVVVLGVLAIGTTLGFLALNYPRGKLFLGDGGAYFLGFWVSEMAVLLLVRDPAVNAWQVLGICGYPVIEVLFRIYRRRVVRKVSPGQPDALHLHALVFRRLVFRRVPRDAQRPWRRNAAVAYWIAPLATLRVGLSVLVGNSTPTGITVVLTEGLLYWLAYGRLVRGRWASLRQVIAADADPAKAQ